MAQWRTSRGGQYDWDRVRNRPALHERHGRSGARFVRAIPDSCWNFPIGARHSRFVLKFPDSCARFPIRARDSRLRSWAGCRVGRFAPPPGANRSTPRPHLERIAPAFGRIVPIGARISRLVLLDDWHGTCICLGACAEPRGRLPRATRATRATVRGRLLRTRLRGFSFAFQLIVDPT